MTDSIDVDWNQAAWQEFIRDPAGEIGTDVLAPIGEAVAAEAKARALKRTGRMAREIFSRVGSDADGLYVDVVSPARDPETGFPYPVVHEGRRVRDEVPHRSLLPALDDLSAIVDGL